MKTYTLAKGVEDKDYVVGKITTGETVLGILDLENERLKDVALIVPAPEQDSKDRDQRKFYVLPFGFPLVEKIAGEDLSLYHCIKLFPVKESAAKLIEHYENIKDKVVATEGENHVSS